MTCKTAHELLKRHGQEDVLRFWPELDAAARAALLRQIAAIDWVALTAMQKTLQVPLPTAVGQPRPAPVRKWTKESYAAALAAGERHLRAGHVAALLVAGGQGSRLGYDGPKGAYGIGPVSDLPLFYFHARKLVRLARKYGRSVPFYIMTSEANDTATRACFVDYNYFGLNPADVIFFKQGMWPALDGAGRLLLATPGTIFVSPDGHGGTLAALDKNGCLDDMRERGVRSVFYFQVDNPLVEIAEPAFIGLHVLERADMSLKLCLKRTPDEKMGAVALLPNGCHAMIEYSELTPAQAAHFKYGSPAIHVFALPFLRREARKAMPLHVAHKKIAYVDVDGEIVTPTAPNGYKFEKFIFDVLPAARRVVNLAFERDDEFSPVKNADGEDSPESCRAALQGKWRRWLAEAGVVVPPTLPLELDPATMGGSDDVKRGLLLG